MKAKLNNLLMLVSSSLTMRLIKKLTTLTVSMSIAITLAIFSNEF